MWKKWAIQLAIWGAEKALVWAKAHAKEKVEGLVDRLIGRAEKRLEEHTAVPAVDRRESGKLEPPPATGLTPPPQRPPQPPK